MLRAKKLIPFMVILPWLSVPFIGTRSFKRFLPGALFMCSFLLVEGIIAEKRKWWWFLGNFKPNVLGELPLIVGPFFIGSIWIFKYTYGKLKLYLFVNTAVDCIFVYFVLIYFKKISYVSLVRLTKFQLSLIFFAKSIFMYAFQFIFEKLFRRQPPSNLPND
jgi:hypothetical protein